MITQDTIKISSAFVKAQKAFAPALKTSTNPHFKSKYVDLAACIEAVLDALNANGIALIQKTHACDDGVSVETVFLHECGEMLSGGRLNVPASKQDAQGYGSALTYARRYSLMAACGIAPEDDDGNAATKSPPKPRTGVAQDVLATSPAMTPVQVERIGNLCANVMKDFAAYGAQAAYERIDEQALEDTEKIYLSTLMPSDVRNSITKYSRELHSKGK